MMTARLATACDNKISTSSEIGGSMDVTWEMISTEDFQKSLPLTITSVQVAISHRNGQNHDAFKRASQSNSSAHSKAAIVLQNSKRSFGLIVI